MFNVQVGDQTQTGIVEQNAGELSNSNFGHRHHHLSNSMSFI